MVVSWFSAGVSSAIATKLALEKYPDLKVIYIHIDDQHPDTLRFVDECEKWFGVKIERLQSRYKNVDAASRAFGYLVGPTGAKCTGVLKKRVRKEWELTNTPSAYVWGMDCTKKERERAQKLIDAMPEFEHIFPLIDKQITKEIAHGMLAKAGINRPVMYDLGYPNNNCLGCVKGGAGYWNKIRVDFPDVFASRAKLERDIGASCIRVKEKDSEEKRSIFLDELPPKMGRKLKIIMEDCGIFCEIKS